MPARGFGAGRRACGSADAAPSMGTRNGTTSGNTMTLARNLMSSRRALLGGVAAGAALALFVPDRLRAADASAIKLGLLVPLTEEDGPYGPSIMAAQQAVVAEVNEAGGLLGRRLDLVIADDQADLGATVRAARTLIDADKVASIMG